MVVEHIAALGIMVLLIAVMALSFPIAVVLYERYCEWVFNRFD